MGKPDSYSKRWVKNIGGIIQFLELEQFSYYYLFAKTLNLVHVKFILAYLNQYSPIKNIKGSTGGNIHTLEYGWKYCGNSSYLWI